MYKLIRLPSKDFQDLLPTPEIFVASKKKTQQVPTPYDLLGAKFLKNTQISVYPPLFRSSKDLKDSKFCLRVHLRRPTFEQLVYLVYLFTVIPRSIPESKSTDVLKTLQKLKDGGLLSPTQIPVFDGSGMESDEEEWDPEKEEQESPPALKDKTTTKTELPDLQKQEKDKDMKIPLSMHKAVDLIQKAKLKGESVSEQEWTLSQESSHYYHAYLLPEPGISVQKDTKLSDQQKKLFNFLLGAFHLSIYPNPWHANWDPEGEYTIRAHFPDLSKLEALACLSFLIEKLMEYKPSKEEQERVTTLMPLLNYQMDLQRLLTLSKEDFLISSFAKCKIRKDDGTKEEEWIDDGSESEGEEQDNTPNSPVTQRAPPPPSSDDTDILSSILGEGSQQKHTSSMLVKDRR
jgi:hypothetical protein